jgi:hypothetical protein
MDIIGLWGPAVPDTPGAVYADREMWTGPFRWENHPGLALRLKTSKNRARADFYLDDCPLLFPLLGVAPNEERVGRSSRARTGFRSGSAASEMVSRP